MSDRVPREAPDRLLAVADAAVAWWAMKRPMQWSTEAHLARPTINCATDAEKALARAVSEWCALRAGEATARS